VTQKPEETVIFSQRHDKHASLATVADATIKELLETAFSVQSMLRLCSE
jgi:hypothetical protein